GGARLKPRGAWSMTVEGCSPPSPILPARLPPCDAWLTTWSGHRRQPGGDRGRQDHGRRGATCGGEEYEGRGSCNDGLRRRPTPVPNCFLPARHAAPSMDLPPCTGDLFASGHAAPFGTAPPGLRPSSSDCYFSSLD